MSRQAMHNDAELGLTGPETESLTNQLVPALWSDFWFRRH